MCNVAASVCIRPWLSQEVIDYELQGSQLPAEWARRVSGESPFYVTPEFSQSYGMQLVSGRGRGACLQRAKARSL